MTRIREEEEECHKLATVVLGWPYGPNWQSRPTEDMIQQSQWSLLTC